MENSLSELIGRDSVLTGDAVRRVYSSDSYTVESYPPTAVVLPRSTEDVSRVIAWCSSEGIPFTPRGAGTGLSGGAMPALGGVVVSTKKLTSVLDYSIMDEWLLAQAGIANLKLTKYVEPYGFHFAPDPSSQSVSTLGGNIAMNSGGPHTLKYGVTAQHILGVKMVCASGEVVTLGGPFGGDEDLLSLVVGSEGTVGLVTEAWVRLTPNPAEVATATICFSSIEDASCCVGSMVRSGVMPAALEMMDHFVLSAVAQSFELEYPTGTAAMLLVETDGAVGEAHGDLNQLIEIGRTHGAIEMRVAQNSIERQRLWTARKKGVGALGRLAPTVVTHDGVIPPSRLPEMLTFVYEVAAREGLGVANIFHAGDGNLHPIFYFDERKEGAVDAVVRAGEQIIEKCLEFGGSVTGEHGVGVEKVDLLTRMFSAESLTIHGRMREVFESGKGCNPCKVIPNAKGCIEHKMRWRGTAT
ncbi:MAG: FAD-binding oxidoreductase [Fimbriimonadaceae bacterium]